MKMKKLFALLLASVLLVSLCACAGTEDGGSTDGIAEGPFAKESDEAMIGRFTTAYANALDQTGRMTKYSLAVTRDGDLQKSAVGLYVYQGAEFSAERETTEISTGSVVRAVCIYADGVLYTASGDGYVSSAMPADSAFNELHLQGIALDMLAPEVIKAQSLTRNKDGSFTVNAVLTSEVNATVIGYLLDEAGLSFSVENCTLNVYLDGTADGELEAIRQVLSIDVPEGETTVQYRVESRAKFESVDPATIEIKAPGINAGE